MPAFLEDKLKQEYPNNPRAVYGTLNAIGAMHGNKETAKGAAMDAKHAKDVKAGTADPPKRKARPVKPAKASKADRRAAMFSADPSLKPFLDGLRGKVKGPEQQTDGVGSPVC